jgi:hypothetical protein
MTQCPGELPGEFPHGKFLYFVEASALDGRPGAFPGGS